MAARTYSTIRFPTHIGPVEIAIDTLRVQLPGFANPVRRGLVAEVCGEAASSKEAVEGYANFARGVAAVLSVAGNAPVGHFTTDIVFEDTPGKREREYYRRSLPVDPGVLSPGRRLDAARALALFTGWMHMRPAKRLERWNRAAVQYQLALLEWEPGAEIPATNHLWVGMEALTPIALEQYLVDWEPVEVEISPDADGDAGIALAFDVVPHLADGASFVVDGVQVLLPNVGEVHPRFIGPRQPRGTPAPMSPS